MLNGLKKVYRKAFVTDHPAVLLIGNLRAPQRIVKRIEYDQVVGRVPLISKSVPAKPATGPIDEETVETCLRSLRDEGIAILPGYFAEEAGQMWDTYIGGEDRWPAGDFYYRTFFGPLGNPLFARVALNETILTIAARHYGASRIFAAGRTSRSCTPRTIRTRVSCPPLTGWKPGRGTSTRPIFSRCT